MKLKTAGALVALSLTLAPALLSQGAGAIEPQAIVSSEDTQELVKRVQGAKTGDNETKVTAVITSQKDLDDYLKKTGTDLTGDYLSFKNNEKIVWPKNGTYVVHNGWTNFSYFSNGGDVDFNGSLVVVGAKGGFQSRYGGDQKGRKVSNLTVIGSVEANPDVNKVVEHPEDKMHSVRGATNSLLHADNIAFENMTYLNAQGVSTHIFDIMGSENVLLNKIKIRGYGIPTSKDNAWLTELNKVRNHAIFSEAIQFDVATSSASGGADLTPGKHKHFEAWWGDTYDAVPTRGARLVNSEITGYKGPSGIGLINGTGEIVEKYGAGLGSHSYSPGKGMTVHIDNLLMADTVTVNGTKDNMMAPIKFMTAEGDHASLPQDEKIKALANSPVRQKTELTLNNVRFRNVRNSGFWNRSGIAETTSIWTIWFEDVPDVPENRIILEDESAPAPETNTEMSTTTESDDKDKVTPAPETTTSTSSEQLAPEKESGDKGENAPATENSTNVTESSTSSEPEKEKPVKTEGETKPVISPAGEETILTTTVTETSSSKDNGTTETPSTTSSKPVTSSTATTTETNTEESTSQSTPQSSEQKVGTPQRLVKTESSMALVTTENPKNEEVKPTVSSSQPETTSSSTASSTQTEASATQTSSSASTSTNTKQPDRKPALDTAGGTTQSTSALTFSVITGMAGFVAATLSRKKRSE